VKKSVLLLFSSVSISLVLSAPASAEWVEVPKEKIPAYLSAIRQRFSQVNCPTETRKYINEVMDKAGQVYIDSTGRQPSIKVSWIQREDRRSLVIVTTTPTYDAILQVEQRDEEYQDVAKGSLIDPVLEKDWVTTYSSTCE